MANSEFTLVNHETSLARLKATMHRVGVACDPDEFIRSVSNAYHEVEAPRHAVDMHEYFRASGGHKNFKQALLTAKESLNRPVSVLNVGCGAGFDLEVMREVFANDEVKKMVCCDISADMQAIARAKANGYPCRFVLAKVDESLVYGPYDLIVTHAMIHHVPDLSAFLELLSLAIVPGGAFVMGHEPNARYWSNAECMSVLKKFRLAARRRNNFRRYLEPSRYLYKIARLTRLISESSLESKVNRILRERYGFKSDLTPREIHRLVDIHVPDWTSGDFKIGFDGFDWEQMRSDFLQDFELAWVATSGYLGETCSPKNLSRNWQETDAELARKYPLDGSNFSAFWRKRTV